ncbi:MAG: hypothetical protein K1X36_13825 [Pyrinomonadaceae bacterium]|nr:hypothetical protein [Pyrinomonadaceae bacterium]
MEQNYQIITFYEFKRLGDAGELSAIREKLRQLMSEAGILGTIILAEEGFNSTVCGTPAAIAVFVEKANVILETELNFKSSFHDKVPFRKIDVKIKPEIVTLKRPVDIGLGAGTHVSPERWNEIIADPDTIVLDTRNDYEFRNGTFRGAINPHTEKFSELPEFVDRHLSADKQRNIAMFCTGGIRCEKFAPYMKQLGYENIFQLEGGILKYIEVVKPDESLWEGECFVFDDRRTVDENLEKGIGPDMSQIPPEDRG